MDLLTGYALVEVFLLVVKVWALVVCLRSPRWAWERADRSRSTWVVLLVVGLFLPVIGFVLALWFLVATSVQIDRMQRLGPLPGFPGGR